MLLEPFQLNFEAVFYVPESCKLNGQIRGIL